MHIGFGAIVVILGFIGFMTWLFTRPKTITKVEHVYHDDEVTIPVSHLQPSYRSYGPSGYTSPQPPYPQIVQQPIYQQPYIQPGYSYNNNGMLEGVLIGEMIADDRGEHVEVVHDRDTYQNDSNLSPSSDQGIDFGSSSGSNDSWGIDIGSSGSSSDSGIDF